MEGIHIEVVDHRPRFKTVGELQDERRNRMSPNDRKNRINKARTDADVLIHKLDKALNRASRSAPTSCRAAARSHGAPRRSIEYSRHAGRILGIK